LTRCILHFALRAYSLRSHVRIGCPADSSRSKFAPGEFVNHSATSPLVKIPSPTRTRGLHITDGD
jgi:hypothetical protein